MDQQREQLAKDLIEKRRKLPKGEKLPFAERNIIQIYLKNKGISDKKPKEAPQKGVKIPVEMRKKGF